jgi:hypothetical protein
MSLDMYEDEDNRTQDVKILFNGKGKISPKSKTSMPFNNFKPDNEDARSHNKYSPTNGKLTVSTTWVFHPQGGDCKFRDNVVLFLIGSTVDHKSYAVPFTV